MYGEATDMLNNVFWLDINLAVLYEKYFLHIWKTKTDNSKYLLSIIKFYLNYLKYK